MTAILAFAAALLAFRLAGLSARRRRPADVAWAWALAAYAIAAAAIAWGEAAGWDAPAFRVYYGAGALVTVPLLAAGSLLLDGRRRLALAFVLAAAVGAGVALAMPVHGAFADGLPAAQDHLSFAPARLLAIVLNSVGTVVVVVIAIRTLQRRPLGNALILAGVAAAAIGSGIAGLGAGGAAAGIAVGVALLYAGFTAPTRRRAPQP